jgi:hypothetical protein
MPDLCLLHSQLNIELFLNDHLWMLKNKEANKKLI